ncbi:MAG: nucleotidyltransferase [Acidimicrobiales bacterium]|nr:nucleotidyltransferase [Acidimicrobiales bacterium]
MLTRQQAFEELRSNLELTALQEKTVATRQKNVRDAVAAQLFVAGDFLTGSYRRHTMIGPLKAADVDIVVVLDGRYKVRGPKAVLELVKKALLVEYTRTPRISQNGQAVTITFTDFVVDVVPAFVRPWWTWNEGWEICDSGSATWITTNPKKHVELSATANRAHAGQLVPRIKQLKAWNLSVGAPLRSFHLEALAWSIFGTSWLWKNGQSSDWASARYFFKNAQGDLRNQLPDPGGTGSDVAAYLHGTALDSAVSKVTAAHEQCGRAEKCAMDEDVAGMHKAYGQVFGEYYPF